MKEQMSGWKFLEFGNGGLCDYRVLAAGGEFRFRVEIRDLDQGGTSVTNGIEEVAAKIFVAEELRDRCMSQFVEWFSTDGYGETCEVKFGLVIDEKTFGRPTWRFIRAESGK